PAWAEPPKKTMSPAESQELKDLEKVVERYEGAGGEHVGILRDLLEREYTGRLAGLERRYQQPLDGAEREARKRLGSTMAMLKDFLGKYADDKKYTPDAMFRLAGLYLDEAKYDWDEKEATAVASALADGGGAETKYVGPDFTPAIRLWR